MLRESQQIQGNEKLNQSKKSLITNPYRQLDKHEEVNLTKLNGFLMNQMALLTVDHAKLILPFQ